MANRPSLPSPYPETLPIIPTSPPSRSPKSLDQILSSPNPVPTPTPIHPPDPLTYYTNYSYAGTPLPPTSPLSTGIWPNATATPHHYISSNGLIFPSPPLSPSSSPYAFQAPTNLAEENKLQEALAYTWKDFDGWVGWEVPRWEGDRMKSYHEQWDFIQWALCLWWKGPKNLAPRLVSVGAWKRGVWDFGGPRWEGDEGLEGGLDGLLGGWGVAPGDGDGDENGKGKGKENSIGVGGQEEREERRVVRPTVNIAELDRAWNELHSWRAFGDNELDALFKEEEWDDGSVEEGFRMSPEAS